MADRPSIFHWRSILFTLGVAAVVGAICIVVTSIVSSPASHNTSVGPGLTTPAATSSLPSPETIAVTLPSNSAYSGTVSVAIPQHVIDKVAPPGGGSAEKTLQSLIPGLSGLLGALIGGGVTYLTTAQKNKADRAAAMEARQQALDDRKDVRRTEIKNRSFEAVVDAVTAGRKITAAARDVWVAVFNRQPRETVLEEFKAFDAATHDWYPAYEVLRLTVPSSAEAALEEYRIALGAFTAIATNWKDAYIAGNESTIDIETGDEKPPSETATDEKLNLQQNYDKCDRFELAVYEKRNALIAITKAHFDDGAWSDNPSGRG
jgi:hypothetical protein